MDHISRIIYIRIQKKYVT